jgi:hypothetical protein
MPQSQVAGGTNGARDVCADADRTPTTRAIVTATAQNIVIVARM